MTGRTNYTKLQNTDPMNGPAQVNAVSEHFDKLAGETKPNAAALPATGNWAGREIMVEDTSAIYKHLDGWVLDRYLTTPAFVGTTTTTATTAGPMAVWSTIYDPLGMFSAGADNRITIRRDGVYSVTGRFVQAGTNTVTANGTVNGAQRQSICDGRTGATGATASPHIASEVPFYAGDYLQFELKTNTGTVTFFATSQIALMWLRPTYGWVA